MNHAVTRAWPLLAIVLVGLLAACTVRIDTQGYLPHEDLLGQIKVGVTGRAEVAERLGSPSSASAVPIGGAATWYYIMRRTKVESFFQEEVLNQRVVAIEFDDEGVVSGMHNYDLADAREIDPVDRQTPTFGKELGLLEQFFGNIGRLGRLGQ